MRTRDFLLNTVRARIDSATASWLDQALERATGRLPQLLEQYTAASSRLGAARLEAGTADRPAELAAFPFDAWTLEDAGRLVLLLARYESMPQREDFAADAVACFEQGDAREQRSWLRAVALLPDPVRFRPVVVDACRTNILPNFEAVTCENPYPAEHFPERNFNQMVLKALFNNVALSRIVGLKTRGNAELARMAHDYAAERTVAGRSVPPDIALATAGQGEGHAAHGPGSHA